MSESRAKIPFVLYDADVRIDQDLLCLSCGYNLRTMHDDRDCPECGARISDSARIGWLLQCDPAWLRRLARSTIWIGIALVFYAVFLLFYMSLLLDVLPFYLPLDVGVLLRDILGVGVFTGLVGFWQLTARHGGSRPSRYRLRQVARWSMVAGLAGVYVAVRHNVLLAHGGPEPWVLLCAPVCLGVGTWATLTYAAKLAARIPEPRLVKHLRIIRWGFALCVLLLVRFEEWDTDVIVTIFAGLLILCLWTMPFLVWYRRRLRAAAAMAQQWHPSEARCRWRRIIVGGVLVLLLAYPLVTIGGWWREEFAIGKYRISYSEDTHGTIAPAWLVDRLPRELGRFLYRVDGLTVDDPSKIAACPSLPYLRKLAVYGGLITDADLVHLQSLSKLERLDLSGTQVTDAGLVHLKGLTKLQHLDLSGTQVTDAGVAKIEQALPKVKVSRR